MDETELKQLHEWVYEEVTKNLPRNGELCSFAVNTGFLKEKLEEMYPGFEVEIIPTENSEFEVVFKKMVTVIEIEIDQDKIMKKIKEEE